MTHAKCSLATSRERVAMCPVSAVNLWVVRTSGRKRECGSLAPLIARRVRHCLGPLRGLANMIPYTLCSSSFPTQDRATHTSRYMTCCKWTRDRGRHVTLGNGPHARIMRIAGHASGRRTVNTRNEILPLLVPLGSVRSLCLW